MTATPAQLIEAGREFYRRREQDLHVNTAAIAGDIALRVEHSRVQVFKRYDDYLTGQTDLVPTGVSFRDVAQGVADACGIETDRAELMQLEQCVVLAHLESLVWLRQSEVNAATKCLDEAGQARDEQLAAIFGAL